MTPIANNEAGSSVRTKLNKMMALLTERMATKSADQTKANAAGMGDDADLTVPVESGENYVLRFSLVFAQSTANDNPQITWSKPAITGNADWLTEQIRDGGNPSVQYSSGAILPITIIPTASGTYEVRGWIRLKPSASGNVVLNWGCNGSGSATLKAGSWIRIDEVSP